MKKKGNSVISLRVKNLLDLTAAISAHTTALFFPHFIVTKTLSLLPHSSIAIIVLMEIPQKLFKFKYHFIAALLLAFTVSSFAVLAPRFLTVLAYFWPLFLSTALFLALVLVFGRTSSSSSAAAAESSSSSSNATAGEVFLDYVAGHHELQLESQAGKSD